MSEVIEQVLDVNPFKPDNKEQVRHTGPIYCDGFTAHVIMASITLNPGEEEYIIQVWVPRASYGYQTRTRELVKGLWESALPVLNNLHIDVETALPDVRTAILTLAGEMDRKTNDKQRIMVELGTPSIKQLEPKK